MNSFDFTRSIIKKNYSVDKRDDLWKFFFPLHLGKFKIKKTVEKETTLDNILYGGAKDKQTDDGILEEFVINNHKFIVRLVHSEATDIKGHTHTIKFVSIDDMNEESITCAILNFDYKQKSAYIQSIGNHINCVLCANKRVNYKIGQLIMRIIIKLCTDRKDKINNIQLHDISRLSCMNTYKPNPNLDWEDSFTSHDTFDLKILSTLQYGETYYSKYGFRPKTTDDKEVFAHNKQVYNKKISLGKFMFDKFVRDNIKDKKHIVVYEKYIVPTAEKFKDKPISEFIKELFNINPRDPIEKSNICYILSKIYKPLYDILGYRTYKEAKFKMDIK